MNIFEIESEREKILDLFSNKKTPRLLLYNLSLYFEDILEIDNRTLTEAYINEFLPQYKKKLKEFDVEGIPPLILKNIISTGDTLSETFQDKEVEASIAFIKKNFALLTNILEGKEEDEDFSDKITFPVLENIVLNGRPIGGLEFVEITIKLRSDLSEDEFVLVPSHLNIDERLEKQIKVSWLVALKKAKRFVKPTTECHEIIIKFKKKFGYYEGNSLGIVLSISLLREILKFYNSRYLILPQPGLSATGSIDKEGNTKTLGKDIISNKLEVVFYSNVKKFVVPKEDEKFAAQQLDELKKKFPGRKLSIIGIESLDDILDRRNLIKIKKENNAVWAYKKIKSNKLSLATIIFSLLFVGYFLFMRYDTNPAILQYQPSKLLVKNKAGRVLWTNDVATLPMSYQITETVKNRFTRLVDLDNDGVNEVLTVNELNRGDSSGGIACYNAEGKEIWYYQFKDSVATKVEEFSEIYTSRIVDIYEVKDSIEILISGQHINFYPTPFYKLNKNGKLVDDILWHPGATSGGFLEDIDNDGVIELVAAGISNGYEQCVLFSIEYDKLRGTAPTKENYKFLNMEIAEFDNYLILPKSDYNRIRNFRYNAPIYSPYISLDKIIINLDEEINTIYEAEGFVIEFDKDFSHPNVIIGDQFRVLRDSLVVKGILNPPLTDTREYTKILEDQIRYWNREEFVTHDEYFKNNLSEKDSQKLTAENR